MTTKKRYEFLLYPLIFSGIALLPPPLLAKNLGADPFSVSWKMEQQQYRCTLEQDIPDFGKIVFSQNSDSDIALEVHALTPLHRGNKSLLKARPPSWRSDISGYLITQHSRISPDDTRANFSRDDSKRAFRALHDGFGLQLTLIHGSPAERLTIAIEGLGFNAFLSSFDHCIEENRVLQIANNQRQEMEQKAAEKLAATVAQLGKEKPKTAALNKNDAVEQTLVTLQKRLADLPDDFRIPFDAGDTELSGSSAKQLDQLLRRWQLHGMPPQISLHGHADDADRTGSYIHSDLRTQSVVRYLLTAMPKLKLRIVAHGDTLPLEDTSAQRVDVVPSDLPNWD